MRIEQLAAPSTLLLSAVALLAPIPAGARGNDRVVSAQGVRFVVPAGWRRVRSAPAGPVTDPQTLLVVGTQGVTPQPSQCQIAAYRIPPSGAMVVVVRWESNQSTRLMQFRQLSNGPVNQTCDD